MLSLPRNARLRFVASIALAIASVLAGICSNVHAQGKAHVHTVVIEAMRFSPETVEVRAGDTIVWKNKDPFPHTATVEGRGFDSGEIAPGRSWSFKARKTGAFSYVCALHPTMRASLIVK